MLDGDAFAAGQPRWLIVGSRGTLGSALMHASRAAGLAVTGACRHIDLAPHEIPFDLAAPASSWRLPDRVDVAFLAAAVTSIAQCEQEPARARQLNVIQTVELARTLHARGVAVIFLSTNQVFDGRFPLPAPSTPPSPLSAYGRLKAEAEARLLELGDGVSVVRLTKVLPPSFPLFTGWTRDLLAGRPIHPFGDLRFAPLPLAFVAEAILRIGARRRSGISHLSPERDLTYADAALLIARAIGADLSLVQPRLSGGPASGGGAGAASIAPHATLDAASTLAALGLACPSVETAILEAAAAPLP